MSAQQIFDFAIPGSVVKYSDGTPRPPERHRRKLADSETRNNGGRLIRKQAETVVGRTTLPASITLHESDYGQGGVIKLRVHQIFSVNTDLKFSVVERPAIGSALVLDRSGDEAELVHLAANRADAETWLKSHGHPKAVLREVTADEVAADAVEGRAAASARSLRNRQRRDPWISGGTSFGRSADGMPVALVGETAFAMAPAATAGTIS